MSTIYIGIDPSINSTGLTIYQNEIWHFYRIAPHFTRAELNCNMPYGNDWDSKLIRYDKKDSKKDYQQNEIIKTYNFRNIVKSVVDVVNTFTYNEIVVGMEGISYGSLSHSQAIYDLAGLNFLFRNAFADCQLIIIPPSEVKKFATGKGNADKDLICSAFKGMFPEIVSLKKYDDIADSFFIANIAKTYSDNCK